MHCFLAAICVPKLLVGSEAVQVAHHMAEEQENLSIYAFGVGCGVDRCGLFLKLCHLLCIIVSLMAACTQGRQPVRYIPYMGWTLQD